MEIRPKPGGDLPARLRDVIRLLGKGPRARERARLLWPGPQTDEQPVLAEGPHLVEEAFENGAPMHALVVDSGWEREHAALANAAVARGIPVFMVSGSVFASLAATRTPQGVLVVCGIRVNERPDWQPSDVVLALDRVQDPGNVGSILRTARATGVRSVALGGDSARPDDAKTVRASQGAVFTLRLWRGDLAAWCQSGRERDRPQSRLIATEPRGGRPPWEVDLTGPVTILLGGEGRGLDRVLARRADVGVTLPMRAGESLGVAAAAAALLYERMRQEETS